MTLAFLASRKGYLKVLGSLIQVALDRGHRVVLLRDPGQGKPGEATTDADFRAWPTAVRVDYRWGAPLGPVLEPHGVRALTAPSLYLLLVAMGRAAEARELKRRGLRLYSVDYAFETVTSDPEGYRIVDVTCYQSAFQRELHWAQPRVSAWTGDFAALRRELDVHARSAVSGSTMLDQRARVGDRAALRRKYGLPPDGPVVLFMSLKMEVGAGERRLVWGGSPAPVRAATALARGRPVLIGRILAGNPYRELTESLREFCRRNRAALVVKSREKNRDPVFVRSMADVLVERDDEVYPYTSMQLMGLADLCVHFQSGAVLEAAHCGVPSLSVKVEPPYDRDLPAYAETWEARPGSLQNWDGLVWSAALAAAPARLAGATLGHFEVDPDARRRYVERYLGFDDTRSSERVLDVIERDAA
ncbi:MAG TPA: hypothetical protein VNC82_06555 [Candidatus Limnocylindria bacterium]|nr:hypothetical protein [Candidatus Limnocylindria bacterium]